VEPPPAGAGIPSSGLKLFAADEIYCVAEIARPCPSSGRFSRVQRDGWCGAETLRDEASGRKASLFIAQTAIA